MRLLLLLFAQLAVFATTQLSPGILVGTGAPVGSDCKVIGQLYFRVDATAGTNLYYCTSVGVWSQQTSTSPTTFQWPYIQVGGTYTVQNMAVTPPVPANWTSVNLGSSTRTDFPSGAISLVGATGSQWRLVCTPLPSPPYSIRLTVLLPPSIVDSEVKTGIGWYESGTGELSLITIKNVVIRWENWTNVGAISATVANNQVQPPYGVWSMQFSDDNTNRYIKVWTGGQATSVYAGTQWQTARTTFLTPDRACFGVYTNDANYFPFSTLVGYDQ